MPPKESDQSKWFLTNLLPHEPVLRTWLCKRFPQANNIDDIIQDSYVKALKARESRLIRSPKSFLFATARNLAIDDLKSPRNTRKVSYEETMLSIVPDVAADVPEAVARRQELMILKEAVEALPERCRQIVTLCELFGIPRKDVAKRLGIAPSTVSDQLVIGLRKCAAYVEKYRRERI